jgi:hypothetical protein
MGQFAPVAPIQILEAMKERKVLGTYHLLLTHHVLEHKDRFGQLFNRQAPGESFGERGPQMTVIMDNSIVELGGAQNEDAVLEAYNVIRDQGHWVYPVLADVMGDGPATREAIKRSYDIWVNNEAGADLMAVLQGNDFTDFCRTADMVLLDPDYRHIHYVGIPRILTDTIGSRWAAIKYVEAIRPDISIHLLGFSNNVMDDVTCANHPGVEGIDSAVPIRYSHSVPLGRYTPTAEIPPRPADWFEVGEWDDTIYTNLENVRRWCA